MELILEIVAALVIFSLLPIVIAWIGLILTGLFMGCLYILTKIGNSLAYLFKIIGL